MFTIFLSIYFIINAFLAGIYWGENMRFSDDLFDRIGIAINSAVIAIIGILLVIGAGIWQELIKKGWNKLNFYVPMNGIVYFYFTDKFKNLEPRVLKDANNIFQKENKGRWHNRLNGWLLNKINDKNGYIHGVTPMNPGLGIDEELMNW